MDFTLGSSNERVEKINVWLKPGLLTSQARLDKSIVLNEKSHSKRKKVEKNHCITHTKSSDVTGKIGQVPF